MPSPGAPVPPRLPVEDSYLELLADTLESLDLPARGQFLQRYIRAITHLDLRETQCIQLWDEMLSRRRELSENLGRPVALKTALMDVLASAGLFRVPIVIEYDELKTLQLNAVTDPLTGLYNRRLFSETFEKELNRGRRYGSPLGLVVLDLHRFKEVNDKHGHPRGDEVLRAAAATLKKALRTSDSAFRIGGDEFALLLPQTDAEQALALSRRIETVFAEMLHSLQLTVGVSMDHGVATFPQDGEQAEQLIRVADERLYRLKHANHGKSGNGGSRTQTDSARAEQPSSPERPAAPPAPISIESGRAPERPEPKPEPAKPEPSPSSEASKSSEAQAQMPRSYTIQRKAERVSMAGTNAYATLGEQGIRRARVLDLGFGGVAIELDAQENLPENLIAVLHVPILPPVRVSLKPVWSQRTTQGSFRVGCAFIS
jgi:diguanylate cyclase (GGDEF)-like protein